MVLSEKELRELTDRKHPAAQMRQLNAMGIKFTSRADGSLAVSRAVALAALGEDALNSKDPKPAQPDWTMANA